MLLPEMFTAEQSPDALVAVAGGGTPLLAGAIASGTVHGPGALGFPAWVHVVPEFRRQGIGRALLAALADHCRGRTPMLRAMLPVAEAGQASDFLLACGVTDFDEIRRFETDTRAFHADMLRVRERLARRGGIPAGARMLRLREAPAERVAALIMAHFPNPRSRLLERLTPGAAEAFDLDNSVALMVDDRLAGVLIFVWQGRVPVIELRIVAPGFRGGWVNAWLLEAATRNGMAAGSEVFQFFAETRIADTMRLAARAGATLIRIERRYWRRL